MNLTPAKDLVLQPESERKAGALAHFVEATAFEESGEIDQALAAYRQVLNVDPGQAELAAHVAGLLARQDDFPQAIDVLKDAISSNPNASEPYLQLAFIYAKYLKRTDQAVGYVNRAMRSIRATSRPINGSTKLKLRSARRIVAFKKANPAAQVDATIYDQYVGNNGSRIDAERAALRRPDAERDRQSPPGADEILVGTLR